MQPDILTYIGSLIQYFLILLMGREKYSKIIFFSSRKWSNRLPLRLFFGPWSNLKKVKNWQKCQKCHFLTFINIWGCSRWLRDMFPCGRGVLLWEREILPVEELYPSGRETFCLWKSSIPLGWLYGRALFPEKKHENTKYEMGILEKKHNQISESKKYKFEKI